MDLLADAGAEDLELTLTIPSFYTTTIPQILVSDLHDGRRSPSTVESVDFSTWLNDVYMNQDYDLSFVLHIEARDFENWADPDYYFTYDNAEVQELFAESLAATDDDRGRRAARGSGAHRVGGRGRRLAVQRRFRRRGRH